MIAIAMALGWASYTLMLWGYTLLRGYNISLVQLVNPVHNYTGQWPPAAAGNSVIIPDGTSASLVNAAFESDTTQGSTTANGGSGGSSSGSSIAADAMGYKGHCYSYGGSPGTSGKNCWDCSSFCNWVLGHDVGITLPDGDTRYNGTSHGPSTLSYLAFGRAVSGGANAAQAGDLCVWQSHMGIALGGGQMISALNERLGTQVTSIPGGAPGGEVLLVRRVSA